MRGKRSKQYRKLMQQYGLHFGFREPYQVLLDADILRDAARFKMDFLGGLERTLHGPVKPLITQCSIRHLYDAEPKDETLIEHAKGFERRRCNHHQLEKPLSTFECLSEVLDPKDTKTNKHRYVVATQDSRLRAQFRRIPGVPMIYLKRSVMIMEPMAGATEEVRQREERSKFRQGLKNMRGSGAARRTAQDNTQDDKATLLNSTTTDAHPETNASTKTKSRRGPANPNPLSIKKAKKRPSVTGVKASKSANSTTTPLKDIHPTAENDANSEGIKKIRRKRKTKAGTMDSGHTGQINGDDES